MHHDSELTREKTADGQQTPPELDHELPTSPSDTDSDDQHSTNDVTVVNFLPGEPANPHNWSKVGS